MIEPWSYTMDYDTKEIVIRSSNKEVVRINEQDAYRFSGWFVQANNMDMWNDKKDLKK